MKHNAMLNTKRFSGFTPILILVLIIALGFIGYFSFKSYASQKGQPIGQSSPSPKASARVDETANWKLYNNSTHGFSVKYPNDWFVLPCGTDNIFLNPKNMPECQGEPTEPIQLFTSPESKTEQEFIKGWGNEFELQKLENPVEIGTAYTKYKVKKVQPAPGPDSFILIRVPLKTGYFVIYNFDLQQKMVADQILSTFKFTNTNGGSSDSKTYINTAFRYQISYPSNFMIENVAAGAKSTVPADANEIYIYDPKNPGYTNRLINVAELDLSVSPGSNWSITNTILDGHSAKKYTSSVSSFDIYQIPQGAGGIEIYVQKNNDSANQILSTLKLN